MSVAASCLSALQHQRRRLLNLDTSLQQQGGDQASRGLRKERPSANAREGVAVDEPEEQAGSTASADDIRIPTSFLRCQLYQLQRLHPTAVTLATGNRDSGRRHPGVRGGPPWHRPLPWERRQGDPPPLETPDSHIEDFMVKLDDTHSQPPSDGLRDVKTDSAVTLRHLVRIVGVMNDVRSRIQSESLLRQELTACERSAELVLGCLARHQAACGGPGRGLAAGAAGAQWREHVHQQAALGEASLDEKLARLGFQEALEHMLGFRPYGAWQIGGGGAPDARGRVVEDVWSVEMVLVWLDTMRPGLATEQPDSWGRVVGMAERGDKAAQEVLRMAVGGCLLLMGGGGPEEADWDLWRRAALGPLYLVARSIASKARAAGARAPCSPPQLHAMLRDLPPTVALVARTARPIPADAPVVTSPRASAPYLSTQHLTAMLELYVCAPAHAMALTELAATLRMPPERLPDPARLVHLCTCIEATRPGADAKAGAGAGAGPVAGSGRGGWPAGARGYQVTPGTITAAVAPLAGGPGGRPLTATLAVLETLAACGLLTAHQQPVEDEQHAHCLAAAQGAMQNIVRLVQFKPNATDAEIAEMAAEAQQRGAARLNRYWTARLGLLEQRAVAAELLTLLVQGELTGAELGREGRLAAVVEQLCPGLAAAHPAGWGAAARLAAYGGGGGGGSGMQGCEVLRLAALGLTVSWGMGLDPRRLHMEHCVLAGVTLAQAMAHGSSLHSAWCTAARRLEYLCFVPLPATADAPGSPAPAAAAAPCPPAPQPLTQQQQQQLEALPRLRHLMARLVDIGDDAAFALAACIKAAVRTSVRRLQAGGATAITSDTGLGNGEATEATVAAGLAAATSHSSGVEHAHAEGCSAGRVGPDGTGVVADGTAEAAPLADADDEDIHALLVDFRALDILRSWQLEELRKPGRQAPGASELWHELQQLTLPHRRVQAGGATQAPAGAAWNGSCSHPLSLEAAQGSVAETAAVVDKACLPSQAGAEDASCEDGGGTRCAAGGARQNFASTRQLTALCAMMEAVGLERIEAGGLAVPNGLPLEGQVPEAAQPPSQPGSAAHGSTCRTGPKTGEVGDSGGCGLPGGLSVVARTPEQACLFAVLVGGHEGDPLSGVMFQPALRKDEPGAKEMLAKGPQQPADPAAAGGLVFENLQLGAVPEADAAAPVLGWQYHWQESRSYCVHVSPTNACGPAALMRNAREALVKQRLGVTAVAGAGVGGVYKALQVAAKIRQQMLKEGRDICAVATCVNFHGTFSCNDPHGAHTKAASEEAAAEGWDWDKDKEASAKLASDTYADISAQMLAMGEERPAAQERMLRAGAGAGAACEPAGRLLAQLSDRAGLLHRESLYVELMLLECERGAPGRLVFPRPLPRAAPQAKAGKPSNRAKALHKAMFAPA